MGTVGGGAQACRGAERVWLCMPSQLFSHAVFECGVDSKNRSNNLSIIKNQKNIQYKNKKKGN
jgi:hypothetical protein